MLKQVKISNFRNFDDEITIDFSKVKDYSFNEECISNGLINKAIIYGRNAMGKSNLGKAIVDIRSLLIDDNLALSNFFNASTIKKVATFHYEFLLEQDEVVYSYQKNNQCEMLFEELYINNKKVFSYDFLNESGDFEGLQFYEGTKTLNFTYWKNNKSVLKYIMNNSGGVEVLDKLMRFVGGMAVVRPSDVSVKFVGPRLVEKGIIQSLIEDNLIEEFEQFLASSGIDLPLSVDVKPDGQKSLYIRFNQPIEFVTYASSGTLALLGLFRIIKSLDLITFLYIDEFDANFHFELAEYILEYIKKNISIQTLITTHNTDLMSNKYMRPDCYMILTNGKLIPIADATERELRQGHNLEKLYQSGEFN